MYDPTIGRWLTEDPIGFEAADPNLYRYCGNDATNATDPSGLSPYMLYIALESAKLGIPLSAGGPGTPPRPDPLQTNPPLMIGDVPLIHNGREARMLMNPSHYRASSDVTDWFVEELKMFSKEATARKAKIRASFAGGGLPLPGAGPPGPHAALLGNGAQKTLELTEMNYFGNLKSDYKTRDFRTFAPVGNRDIVTLCGRNIYTNQLGNIMFGFMAYHWDVVDDARAYGRGDPKLYMKIAKGAKGPEDPWTKAPYKETAFDIGVALAKGGTISRAAIEKLMGMNLVDPIDKFSRDVAVRPATNVFKGPHTVFDGSTGVDESGRRK